MAAEYFKGKNISETLCGKDEFSTRNTGIGLQVRIVDMPLGHRGEG